MGLEESEQPFGEGKPADQNGVENDLAYFIAADSTLLRESDPPPLATSSDFSPQPRG